MGGRVRVDSTTGSRATTSVTSGLTLVSVTFLRSPYERYIDWQTLILLAEIGDLRFFRGEEYQNLFHHLDKTGKFYAERWGDAPSRFPSLLLLSSGEGLSLNFSACALPTVRSVALSMFRNFTNIHFFEDISYLQYVFALVPSPIYELTLCVSLTATRGRIILRLTAGSGVSANDPRARRR